MVKIDNTLRLKVFAWALSMAAIFIAIIGWGQGIHWQVSKISAYKLFPLFGLTAFGVMWSHYIVSAARQYVGIDKKEISTYFEITSWIVLIAIIMHPGLLELQLWRDGFGLPPGSVVNNYVAQSLKWAAWLGMISLLIFLAYELRRWFSDKGWWRAIEIATDIAMVAIFVHALNLGTGLQRGWLRSVWIFYGITLLGALGYIYFKHYAKPQNP